MNNRPEPLTTSLNAPAQTGWYAVLTCYEPQNGYVPGACMWDGISWGYAGGTVTHYWPPLFTNEKAALEYALHSDPHWRPEP